MKKLLFTLLLAAAVLPSWADDPTYLTIVGGATSSGWTDNEWHRTVGRMVRTAENTWVWVGTLKNDSGDNGRFKLPTDLTGWDHGYWAPSQDYVIGSTEADLSTSGTGDNKFRVSEAGMYRITVYTDRLKIKAEKLSEPSKDGDYYQLGTVDEFMWFAGHVTSGASEAKARLTADISFEGKNFFPICSDKFKFKGELDGACHTIDYAIINDPSPRVGLCRYLGPGANIHDLIMGEHCSFTGFGKAGGIAGHARDGGTVTLTNVINRANVTSTGGTSGNEGNSAGLVAAVTNDTKIVATNCANTGTVKGQNGECAAFAGWVPDNAGSTFTNCWNIGNIESNLDGDGNQLCRNKNHVTLTNCINFTTQGNQGTQSVLDASALSSGELCYTLNGDQTSINWYQNLSGTVDATPVPFSSHSQVYANGELSCDGSAVAGGTLTYSNSSSSTIPPHSYVNGFCENCGHYQENALTATDGWYEISQPWQLRWMAESVTEHNGTYGNANIKLTDDIDYTEYTDQAAMFGKPSNTFKGVFDGQNHTVTVAFVNNSAEETGLFRRINGGTVKNLKVAGTISTNQKLAGGICSGIWQKGKILNCESAVTITDNGSGDATHGGILACVHDRSNTDGGIQIINCLFSGTLNASGRTGSGGIIGWPDNGATEVKVYNCLVSGTVTLADNDDNDVIVRNKADVQNTYYSCTLTNNLRNSKNGIAVPAGSAASGYLCYLLNEEVSGAEGWYQTLTGTPDAAPTPFYTSAKVYANGDFYCDGVTPKGEETFSNTEGATIDEHSFTNHLCTGCKAVGQEPSITSGVYQIEDIGHLIWFAAYVNAGNATVSGKLTADINQSDAKYTPIGSSDHPYHGTFDGDYHTVTLNLTDGTKSNQGIFGVLTGGATINNLIAAGNVKGFNAVGGIAGSTHESGNVTFNNCGNEATVEATNANAGGILGVDMNSSAAITMKNVYSAGAIKGVNDNGGLSGWAGNNPTIINSYCISEVQNGSQFCRCNGSSNTNTWGQDQITGTMLTDGTLCAKLGYAFRQNIGSGYPCFNQAQGFVAQIGEAGYSTMYNVYSDVEIPTGIEAYAGVVNGKSLSLVAITGAIAKEEPVVLKGTAGLYNFMPTSGISKAASNDLKGSDGTVQGKGNGVYALSVKNEKVGFYPVGTSENHVTIPAGKAYLEYTGSNPVKGFTFVFDEDDATGIEGVQEVQEVQGAIYNLAGQRINKMQRGINIVNGKKILK